MMEGDEKELVARACSGDIDALDILWRRHCDFILRVIRIILPKGSGDVEDVAQKTFLKAQRGIHSFRGDSQLRTWLYRIAFNESVSHLRKIRPNLHDQLDDNHANEISVQRYRNPEAGRTKRGRDADCYSPFRADEITDLEDEELAEIAYRVLEEFEPKEAAAMVFCHAHGYRAEEVVVMLGFPSVKEIYRITERYTTRCRQLREELLAKRRALPVKSP